MKPETVKVIQDPEQIVSPEVLATAIVRISDGVTRMLASGLTVRAICVLVKDKTGVSLATTESVLDALASLKTTYTKSRKKITT